MQHYLRISGAIGVSTYTPLTVVSMSSRQTDKNRSRVMLAQLVPITYELERSALALVRSRTRTGLARIADQRGARHLLLPTTRTIT